MTSRRHFDLGTILMATAALVGLIIAAIGYADSASGIAGTPGALLVVLSSAVLLITAMVLPTLRTHVRWLHVVAVVMCLLALIGTGVAAYLLELPLLIAAVLVSALGLALQLMPRTRIMEHAQ